MAASINQDRTANRVALCSAIFAGFAYVGYAVVHKVLGGRARQEPDRPTTGLAGFFRNEEDVLGLEYEPQDRGRVFLRRLSGSRAGDRATETILDTEGVTGIASVLRPLSVRERIRELNLNAMAFTDTLLILNGLKPRLGAPRSLPGSTFHSPTRILSPVDLELEFLRAGKALQDESERDSNDNYSVAGTPGTPRLGRRSSRRNFSRRSPLMSGSVSSLSQVEQEEADSRAESLCQEKEQELTRRLESFQGSRPRELTPYEARCLVALLHCSDKAKVGRALVTVSQAAAFTRNQDLLRESGLLVRLPCLLATQDPGVQLGAAMAAANLALNTANMKEMEQVVQMLVLLAEDTNRDAELQHQILLALTNLAVSDEWQQSYSPLLPRLLELWLCPGQSSPLLSLQASKLLVNLSCCESSVLLLLTSSVPPGSRLLPPREPVELCLRSVTFLANLAMAAQRQGLDTVGPSHSLQDTIFSSGRACLQDRANTLMQHHDNYDVRLMASKLHAVLNTNQQIQ